MERREKQHGIDFRDRRACKESSLTIRWWGVLLVIFGLIGWLAVGQIGQGQQIARVEAQITSVYKDIVEIKSLCKEMSMDIKQLNKK